MFPERHEEPAHDAVPAGEVWRLLSYGVTLVTDANAVNRNPSLVIDDGTTANVVMVFPLGLNIAASQTKRIAWSPGIAGQYSVAARRTCLVRWMARSSSGPGMNVRTVTLNRQAGDDYGAPLLYVVEVTLTDVTP
jgi:hypothetical protein